MTNIVTIGGILVTIAVTVFSVGTSGYQLMPVTSLDPNGTESLTTWFGGSLGGVMGSMQPSCASATIPLNSLLYTNNTALRYTLTDVSTQTASNVRIHQGSLIYHNNPLRNCNISSTQIEFESLQRDVLNVARQQQGARIFGSGVLRYRNRPGRCASQPHRNVQSRAGLVVNC
jgi:hypothetical protein